MHNWTGPQGNKVGQRYLICSNSCFSIPLGSSSIAHVSCCVYNQPLWHWECIASFIECSSSWDICNTGMIILLAWKYGIFCQIISNLFAYSTTGWSEKRQTLLDIYPLRSLISYIYTLIQSTSSHYICFFIHQCTWPWTISYSAFYTSSKPTE